MDKVYNDIFNFQFIYTVFYSFIDLFFFFVFLILFPWGLLLIPLKAQWHFLFSWRLQKWTTASKVKRIVKPLGTRKRKDTVAEKEFDNYFHMRKHSIHCKTFPLWSALIPLKMPEQQVGSDAGTEEVATAQHWWEQRRWERMEVQVWSKEIQCFIWTSYIIGPHFILDLSQLKVCCL